jgi:geranylgeranyl diphosphate synthase type II
MRDALRRQADAPAKVVEAMEYSLMAGGKRLRPVLVLESAIACGGDVNASALSAAGAIELIHTFSLVHDDLPAMDNDDLRRGRPTNHKVFGEAMAILAGDGMISLAFELIAVDADAKVAAKLVAELARATGPQGMIGGQVLDMDGEQKSLSFEELRRLHRLKTGALLRASCRLGAIAAGGSEAQLAALTEFGEHLGLAFQIVDDVLDVTSTAEQMGKATGKDAAKGKNTYPALLGLEGAQREAHAQLEAALASLAPLKGNADGLRALARFVVERQT